MSHVPPLPNSDPSEEAANPSSNNGELWPWIVMVVGLHLSVVGFLFLSDVRIRGEFGGPCLMGVIGGQISCAAIWSACGPGPRSWCIPGGMAVAALVWLEIVWIIRNGGGDPIFPLTTAAYVAMQFAEIQLGVYAWRNTDPGRFEFGDESGKTQKQDSVHQFSLLQLMTWMSVIAVLCGIGSFVIPAKEIQFGQLPEQLIGLAIYSVVFAAIAISQVMAWSRHYARPSPIFFALTIPAIIVVVAVGIVGLTQGFPGGRTHFFHMLSYGALCAGIQLAEIGGTFGLLYFAGMHWVSSDDSRGMESKA